jgi:pimeloyl-ACP methyl ester carboxylesterase
LALAVALGACAGGDSEGERFPTSQDYPPGVMERAAIPAGGGKPWTLSALRTPAREAPWRVVIITGTPSWSEYWAPTLAAAPESVEMIVADRPGFALSEPESAVTRLSDQAAALSALLDGPDGQDVILVGQSYGGAIAALIARDRPDKVKGLILLSAFFGERGPTARRLMALGAATRPLLPRDMKNALAEVRAQGPQLDAAFAALDALSIPVLVLHGDADSFVAPVAAEALARRIEAAYRAIPEGDHFLNACCVAEIWSAIEELRAKAG